MKPISSKPAKYVETIGKRKFTKLSSSRQHEYLALLARETLKKGDFPGFIKRYNEMMSWVDLDRYIPPDYLSDDEALHEYILFHTGFSKKPTVFEEDNNTCEKRQNPLSWKPSFNVTVVLDQVRSPFNTGSVLRLIDNFGFSRLIHNASWLRIDHPQLCKSARGAEKWIPVEYIPDLPDWLHNINIPVIGIENCENAVNIGRWKPEIPCVLVIGNEVYGIAVKLREQCDLLVKIPMFGFKQSMNLHHALAIAGHKITLSF